MSDSHVPYTGPYTGDILATSDDEPTRRAPWLLVGGAGVLVLALIGGVTYGVGALSGGGSQPESALPGGAVAFLKVDLDPSAGQKVDGFRFMRQFPALRSKLQGDDLRKIAFEAVADSAGWDDIDFARDVAPWMGDRVAVGVYPPSGPSGDAESGTPEPDMVLAVQVRDEDGAREGLRKLNESSTSGTGGDTAPGFVIDGDYALVAEDQAQAYRAAEDAAAGTLDQDREFSSDLAAAGDGVLAAWTDAEGMSSLFGAGAAMFGSPVGAVGAATGRTTLVARFDGPDAFEVTGQVRGADAASWSSHRVRGMAALPGSSMVAVGLADGDELVTRAFAAIREALGDEGGAGMFGLSTFDDAVAQAEQFLGIELPEDIAVLLGDNVVAALDGGDSGEPQVGARISTDVTRAERVLDAITRASGGALPLERRTVGKDLVVASTPQQADRLSTDGTLGDKGSFTKALPDLEDADAAAWVDVRGLVGLFGVGGGNDPGEVDDDLEPLEGVGLSVSSEGKGSATFRLRVVTS